MSMASTGSSEIGGQLPAQRVAVVTGATGGVGPAIASRLAADGFQLVLTGRRHAALEEVGERLRAETHTEPLAVVAELTSRDQVVRLVDQAMKRFGRIDVL